MNITPTSPLVAWTPEGMNPNLGGVLIDGPVPLALTKSEWHALLQDRIQRMIADWEENFGDPAAIIEHYLEEAGAFPPVYQSIERKNWAANILAGLSMIDTRLNWHDQEWPATVTSSNCDFETLVETTLEEWLIEIGP